jgi:sugar lactone lactonase YvrE
VSECQWTFAAVEKIAPNGVVTRFAGTGRPGFSGDGGAATSAQLYCPAGIAVGPDGAVYFADHVNNRVRRVDAAGVITTFAGSGPAGLNQGTFSGDGGPATEATLQEPWGVAFDQTGRLYIADRDNARVRRVDLDGVISTVAGSGMRGSGGDGSPAIEAEICPPVGIAIDPTGNLVVLEPCTNKVRRVGPDGVITTIIGTGTDGFSGDGGPAALADIGSPDNAIFDSSGAMFLLSSGRIRHIDTDGVITTIAGIGKAMAPTEGSAALQSALGIEAWGLAFDADENLYVADGGDGVFRINEDGVIKRFAGRPPAPQPTAKPTPSPSG